MRLTICLVLFIFVQVLHFAQSEDVSAGTKKAWYQCEKEPTRIEEVNSKTENQLTFNIQTTVTPDANKKKEFDWLVNYPQEYFTAYLINSTDSVFQMERQDGSLIMIQEAKNEKGEWIPIEHWQHSWCGNSYMNPLVLNPGKQVLVPIKKYSGSFKTELRLKLKVGDKIVYSQAFKGSIDKGQFRQIYKEGSGDFHHGSSNYLDD